MMAGRAFDGTPMLGIAITTMNRAGPLKRLLTLLSKYTVNTHTIVVCDDGSKDHTKYVVDDMGATYIGGERRGVAWNKNRGIFYLLNCTSASHILLIDDDIEPTIYGWDEEWIRAVDQFGHVNYAHTDFDDQIIGPRILSATCPGVSKMLSGVCLGFSRQVLCQIGYMDNRFGLYGYEHADFTERALRAGYGGFFAGRLYFFVIRGGIDVLRLPSSASASDIEASTRHFASPNRVETYVMAWHDGEQQAVFLAEMDNVLSRHIRFRKEDILKYVAQNSDIEQSLIGGVEHWLQHGQHEGRRWGY